MIFNHFHFKTPQFDTHLAMESPFNAISIPGTHDLCCKFSVILTLRVYKMEPNGPVRVRLVPFVHSQSYKQIRVHLDPNIHHLAGYPLGLPQGPLGVPGPHFENRSLQKMHQNALNLLGPP